MKERNRLCKYYLSHGSCTRGKDADLKTTCQKCHFYQPNLTRDQLRRNDKKKILAKEREKSREQDY